MYHFDHGFVPKGTLLIGEESALKKVDGLKNINNVAFYCSDKAKLNSIKERLPNCEAISYSEVLADIPREYAAILPAYEYLGDWHPGENINIQFSTYNDRDLLLESSLPAGLKFENNRIIGSTNTEGLLKLTVSLDGQFSKTYFFGSYSTHRNRNNHYDHNYIKSWYTGEQEYSRDSNSVFYKQVSVPNKDYGAPLDEAKKAAFRIKELAGNKEIVLFVSGGVDSQLMARSFMAADIPFKPVFYKDSGQLSSEEYNWVKKFYKAEGLLEQLVVKERDFVEFISSYSYLKYALSGRTNNPEMGLLLSFMDDFKDSYCVFAGGPNYPKKSDSGSFGVRTSLDERMCKSRYMERKGVSGCPEFLSFTPGLFHSTVFSEYFENFMHANNDSWKYKNKIELFKSWGFDTSLAPPTKMTGFEDLYKVMGADKYGKIIWYKHRFPLKQLFPVVSKRNLIQLDDGKLSSNIEGDFLTDNHDLFSLDYATNNLIEEYN